MHDPGSRQTFTFAERWAPELRRDGHVQISSFFLCNYHRLQPYSLTHGEAMFIIHLMHHKWGIEAPYPSYRTISQRMGVSLRTARRFGASLEHKRYLHRELRTGETNLFHLDRLINALITLRSSDLEARSKRRQAVLAF